MSDIHPVARRGVVRIESKAPPQIFRFIARCPGFTKWLDEGGVVFDATRAHLDIWTQMFPDIPIEDADGTLARLYVEKVPIVEVPRLLVPPRKPWEHQNRAHNVMQCRPFYGFFHDMGTGKSATIVQGAAELFAQRKIERALIITTKRGMPQFLNEQLPQNMPAGVNYRAAQIGTTLARKRFQYYGDDLLIAFAAPGNFQSKNLTAQILEFCKGGKTACFVDESQNFKGWANKRVTNLLKIQPHTTHRFLFSGEPQPNGYEDLFAQFFYMDENVLGHASLSSFQNQHCVFGGYQIREVVDYKNVHEIVEKISPHCEFLKIDDCMDMPQRTWREAKYTPTQEQRDLYEQLKAEYRILVERALGESDAEIVTRTCVNAASKFTAMAQVSNGWIYLDLLDETKPREIHTITDERARFVMEDLVASARKCIVWARFHEDLEQLKRVAEELKIDAVEFSGRVKDKDCEAHKLRFQNDPKCRVFYGTTASGGESLNLQVCQTQVFHSNSYNYGHRAQAERRTWRGGQSEHCDYVDVIGLPIDRLIRNNALEKQDLSEQLQLATKMAKLLEEL